MTSSYTNQKLIVPLFGVDVEEPYTLAIQESDFVDHLTAHIFPKPIPLNTGEPPPEDNEPVAVTVPSPKSVIHIIPWSRSGDTFNEANKLFQLSLLPDDFDVFDNLGLFAFRAGPGGLGGFQTITTASTKTHASTVLVMELSQECPETAAPLMGNTNPYESDLVESILDSLRLVTGKEPYPYKGFHITDSKLIDTVIKWPLMEIHGDCIVFRELSQDNLVNTFFEAWKIRFSSRRDLNSKIVTIAMEYYYLSSTMTETRTIFLHLMIAFEALFKTKSEMSASAASARLAKLVSDTKTQYNEIRDFMWNPKQNTGCCQLRNEIIHGNTSSLNNEVYWKLKNVIRCSILRIMPLVLSNDIDKEYYYESLSTYLNRRFDQLPSV